MSVRLKRLAADFDYIGRVFAEHPYIAVKEVEGDPPERYKVEFRLQGLVMRDGKVVTKDTHMAEVYLPLGYPRQAPQCRMLSPIYHPNIAPHAICIGDHWSAGESLAALIARIGEIITFQSYNVKSPLNGEAARWAEEHMSRLPIQQVDLSVGIEGMKPLSSREVVASLPAPAPPRPSVRYPSALVSMEGEGFPHDAWIEETLKELKLDPAGPDLGIPMSSVISRLKAEQLDAAIKDFEPIRAMPGVARLPQVHFVVALIRGARGDLEKQIAALENVVKVDDTYAAAWFQMGVAASCLGQSDRAAAAFRKYLEIVPDSAAARKWVP